MEADDSRPNRAGIYQQERSLPADCGGKGMSNGPFDVEGYFCFVKQVKHHEVGGVTPSGWWVVHLSHRHQITSFCSLMTMSNYSRPLQTALDDTVGAGVTLGSGTARFEPKAEASMLPVGAIGMLRKHRAPKALVFDGEGQGPDLGTLPRKDWYFWVRASSVYSPGKPVLRKIQTYEIFSVWDYEAKQGSKDWKRAFTLLVMSLRFASPPAKIVRMLLYNVCGMAQPFQAPALPTGRPLEVGRTANVPFSPMEAAANARVKAAQPDNAEVDLTPWSLPGETPRVVAARQGLRKFAAMWWARHQVKLADEWLNAERRTEADREAVEDCKRRLKAVTYFSWPRGSRHLFYKVSDPAWRKDF